MIAIKNQSTLSWQEHLFIWGLLLFTIVPLLLIYLVDDPPEYKTLATKELEQFITQYLNSGTDGHMLSMNETLDIPVDNTIQIESVNTIDNIPVKAIHPGNNVIVKIRFPENTEALLSVQIHAIYQSDENHDQPVLDGTHMDHIMVDPEDISENELDK